MKIRSFLKEDGVCSHELANGAYVHPEQLVLEALEMMLKNDCEFLPVVVQAKCIGQIHLRDLITFLSNNTHGNMFHKFNFTIESAITVINKKQK